MRRTRNAAAALAAAGCLIGLAAPTAAAASSDDRGRAKAHVHPFRAEPGDVVTVVVRCEKDGRKVIRAYSAAFDSHGVPLHLVGRHRHHGAWYVGHARIGFGGEGGGGSGRDEGGRGGGR